MIYSWDLTYEVRFLVRRLVEDLVGRDDSPLAIVNTSKEVANHAEASFRQAVSARASGFSWGEIASAIPTFGAWVRTAPQSSSEAGGGSAAAHRDAVTDHFKTPPPDGVAADGAFAPLLHWRCPACEAFISDRGPWDSHPSDMEQGHAGGCPRQFRQIAAHETRWSED